MLLSESEIATYFLRGRVVNDPNLTNVRFVPRAKREFFLNFCKIEPLVMNSSSYLPYVCDRHYKNGISMCHNVS